MASLSERNRAARDLFAPLGPTYDRWSRLLSLGQDPRWRRFLVSRIEVGRDDTVLDVATGTAAVAIELVRRTGCSVVGLDQSPEMLAAGRERVEAAGLADRIRIVEGSAEQLPFPDGSFDALTFTYLLRYVEDPAATLAELARVVQAGRGDRRARVRASEGCLAAAVGGLRPGRAAGRGPPDLSRLARGRLVPGAQHPRASTIAFRSGGNSSSGVRPESRRCACDG